MGRHKGSCRYDDLFQIIPHPMELEGRITHLDKIRQLVNPFQDRFHAKQRTRLQRDCPVDGNPLQRRLIYPPFPPFPCPDLKPEKFPFNDNSLGSPSNTPRYRCVIYGDLLTPEGRSAIGIMIALVKSLSVIVFV